MGIVFGTTLYGMVDRIPGVCHVRTTFAHVMFFPIVPVQSYLVVEGGRGVPDRAHPIRKSLKSVLYAAARAFLLLGFLAAASIPIDQLMEKRQSQQRPLYTGEIVSGVVALLFLGAVVASFPLSRPAADRREYLLKLVEIANRPEHGDVAPSPDAAAIAAEPPTPPDAGR